MRIIISPAKKMNQNTDILSYKDFPKFLERAQMLKEYIESLTFDELKTIYKCSDTIVRQNMERMKTMDLTKQLTPAILSYEGLQYQYMAPQVMSEKELHYIQEHVRILSGMYGILRPMDGVTPYRLEMQAKLHGFKTKNLYDFWGHDIYQALEKETDTIIDLASKEYSKCVYDHQQEGMNIITCVFGELVDGKIKEKGTFAKMARGEMVRYLAEHNITREEDIKDFHRLNYNFDDKRSTKTCYIFVKA